MAQADFWTPQYGFLFQPVYHLRASPYPINHNGSDPHARGYDDNIRSVNFQLSRRFGFRYRPYIAHIGHVPSRSILLEAEALWPEVFFQSEKTRFRFSHDGHGLLPMFLMAHYTIERLRETQLRSFWRYRVDYNGNGVLEWEERWALVAQIMDWTNNGDCANFRRMGHVKHFLTNNEDVLDRTGYRDKNQAAAVTYGFSGMDGPPFLMPMADTSSTTDVANETQQNQPLYKEHAISPSDRYCHFNLEFCLGRKFLTRHGTLSQQNAEKVFKRLAFKEYHCGDCLLALQSDRGVDHYHERIEDAEDDDWGDRVPFNPSIVVDPITGPRLPKKQRQPPPKLTRSFFNERMDDITYDLRRLHNKYNSNDQRRKKVVYSKHKRGVPAILPQETTHPKARRRVMEDLYRYNHVIGKSHHVFALFDNLRNTKKIVAGLHNDRRANKPYQMVSLNDGIVSEEEEQRNGAEIRGLMKEFMEDWYGEPSPWEKL